MLWSRFRLWGKDNRYDIRTKQNYLVHSTKDLLREEWETFWNVTDC